MLKAFSYTVLTTAQLVSTCLLIMIINYKTRAYIKRIFKNNNCENGFSVLQCLNLTLWDPT